MEDPKTFIVELDSIQGIVFVSLAAYFILLFLSYLFSPSSKNSSKKVEKQD
jgi:hypothetical protein